MARLTWQDRRHVALDADEIVRQAQNRLMVSGIPGDIARAICAHLGRVRTYLQGRAYAALSWRDHSFCRLCLRDADQSGYCEIHRKAVA
jgi:hypothetical protein